MEKGRVGEEPGTRQVAVRGPCEMVESLRTKFKSARFSKGQPGAKIDPNLRVPAVKRLALYLRVECWFVLGFIIYRIYRDS